MSQRPSDATTGGGLIYKPGGGATWGQPYGQPGYNPGGVDPTQSKTSPPKPPGAPTVTMPGAPNFNSYNPTGSQGTGMFNNIYNSAMGGTIQSFDNAANRIRERVEAQSRAQKQQANTQNLSRGFGNSGFQIRDMQSINQGEQMALGSGLVDLADKFEAHRQEGLKTALGAGQSKEQAGQFLNSLKQMDANQIRELLKGVFDTQSNTTAQNFNTMADYDASIFGSQAGMYGDQLQADNTNDLINQVLGMLGLDPGKLKDDNP